VDFHLVWNYPPYSAAALHQARCRLIYSIVEFNGTIEATAGLMNSLHIS